MLKSNAITLTSLFCLSLATACGDDSGPKVDTGSTTGTLTAGNTTPTGTPSATGSDATNTQNTGTNDPGQPAVYAILSQVIAPNAQTSYILSTNSFAATPAPLEVTGGIEVPGRAVGVGLPSLGALIVGSSESPVLRRYTLNAQGQFDPTPAELSLAPYGIAGISEYQSQFQVVSPTKAYFFDGKTSQMAVFDPTTMTLVQSVDLSALTRPNTILTFSPRAVRSGNKLIMPVGWRSSDNKQIPSETAVVTIDMNTNQASIATDARCGYARDATVADDGKIYLVADAYAAAVHRLSETAAPKPCVLRFDPMTAAYDAGFYVDATTLVGGTVMGSAVPGPGNSALVSVLNEQLAAPKLTPQTPARALSASPVWNWWQLNLGDTLTATQVAGAPLSNGSQLPLEAGEMILLPNFAPDRSSTTLVELTEQGLSSAAPLQVKGLVFSVTKVR